jgi:hypothetical protein
MANAGTAFRLSFIGDVFETEDQRNWTDASFKTYSTPLSRPFPVSVAAGTVVRQSVLLEAATLERAEIVEAAAATARNGVASGPAATLVRIGGQAGRVPALAVGAGLQPELLPKIPGLDAVVVELEERTRENPPPELGRPIGGSSECSCPPGSGIGYPSRGRRPHQHCP